MASDSTDAFLEAQTVHAESWKNFGDGRPCRLGIDEAGRGPVLGPMVYGVAVSPADEDEQLRALGVDDSKALTEDKRDRIFKLMEKNADTNKIVSWAIRPLSASFISASMLRKAKCSLNEVSHNAAIALIKDAIKSGINIVEIFVDTVGPKASYQAKLEGIFKGISIKVEEKADSKFPVVSAASIAAKVMRDRIVREWIFKEEDVNVPANGYGSGYPGDPSTKAFLAGSTNPVFGYPSLVRFSWKTTETLLDKKAVKCAWENDEEAANSLTSGGWFTSKAKPPKRAVFYRERRVASTVNI